ncbi:MAG: hypothetical protein U0821_23630 [Chloroflexota bacterium]
MRITDQGLVGINTPSQHDMFHVVGTSQADFASEIQTPGTLSASRVYASALSALNDTGCDGSSQVDYLEHIYTFLKPRVATDPWDATALSIAGNSPEPADAFFDSTATGVLAIIQRVLREFRRPIPIIVSERGITRLDGSTSPPYFKPADTDALGNPINRHTDSYALLNPLV